MKLIPYPPENMPPPHLDIQVQEAQGYCIIIIFKALRKKQYATEKEGTDFQEDMLLTDSLVGGWVGGWGGGDPRPATLPGYTMLLLNFS